MGQPQGIQRAGFLSSSVSRDGVLHSISLKGGFQEMVSVEERNSIPLLENSTAFPYNGFTASDDHWSSGRRRVGMLVNVLEENKFYQLIPVGFFGNAGNLGEAEWLALSEWERALRIDPTGSYTLQAPTPGNNFTSIVKTASDIGITADANSCWVELEIRRKGDPIDGHIIPDANETYDLGSPDKNFRDLYLSGNTLYMGGQPLSIVNGQLVLNGAPVTGTPTAGGTSGTSGTSGLNGLIGAKGANGKNGDIGPQGIQGIKGDTGIDGTSGISGTSGTSGVDGAKGDQGIPAPSSPITAKWKWSNATTPTSGRVTTSSGSMHAPTITGITFHDIDSDGINRDATLNAVGPGSIIMLSTFGSPYAGTSEWTVTSVSVSGSYVTFNVTNNTSNGAVQPPIDHLVYAEMSVIPQTIPGPQGIPGFNGEKGAPGSRGSKGDSGAIGAQGLAGNDGTSGTSGIDGPKVGNNVPDLGVGSYFGQLGYLSDGTVYQWDGGLWKQVLDLNGANGAAGQSGTSGVDGAAGQSGTSGTSGVDGAAGQSGTSGVDGAAGQSGTSGTSGVDGTDGQSGTSGTSGVDGAKGATGAQGPAGSSVSSGTTSYTINMTGYAVNTIPTNYDHPVGWIAYGNNNFSVDAWPPIGSANPAWYTEYPLNLTTIGGLLRPDHLRSNTTYEYGVQLNVGSHSASLSSVERSWSENQLVAINPSKKYVVGSLRGIGRDFSVNLPAGGSHDADSYPQSQNEYILYAIKKNSSNGLLQPILLDHTDALSTYYSQHGEFFVNSSKTTPSEISLTDCVAIGMFYVIDNQRLTSGAKYENAATFTFELK